MSLIRVLLIGHLGAEPDLRLNSSQLPVATFRIATTERHSTLNAHTEWHRVVVFGQLAMNCSRFLQKGHQVCVEGSLRTMRYTDQFGLPRQSYRIFGAYVTFLRPPGSPGEESVWVEVTGAAEDAELSEAKGPYLRD